MKEPANSEPPHFKNRLVENLWQLWQEWGPKLDEAIEAMPPMMRIFVRQYSQLIDIPTFFKNLDDDPERVQNITDKLTEILAALEEGEEDAK